MPKPCLAPALTAAEMRWSPNTDFISQVLTYGPWGDSIPSDSGVEPGMCDLDGDGTRNVHDFILNSTLPTSTCKTMYCQAQGEEVLTLVDTVPSDRFKDGSWACSRPRRGPW